MDLRIAGRRSRQPVGNETRFGSVPIELQGKSICKVRLEKEPAYYEAHQSNRDKYETRHAGLDLDQF
jgi:hypothetical protein